MPICWTWFYVIVKWRDWYSGVRAIGPEYGQLYGFGLINYVYYACKLRGLSAFSGARDSLLRCVGGVGEAGASYMNKWFNCKPGVVSAISLSPWVRYTYVNKKNSSAGHFYFTSHYQYSCIILIMIAGMTLRGLLCITPVCTITVRLFGYRPRFIRLPAVWISHISPGIYTHVSSSSAPGHSLMTNWCSTFKRIKMSIHRTWEILIISKWLSGGGWDLGIGGYAHLFNNEENGVALSIERVSSMQMLCANTSFPGIVSTLYFVSWFKVEVISSKIASILNTPWVFGIKSSNIKIKCLSQWNGLQWKCFLHSLVVGCFAVFFRLTRNVSKKIAHYCLVCIFFRLSVVPSGRSRHRCLWLPVRRLAWLATGRWSRTRWRSDDG